MTEDDLLAWARGAWGPSAHLDVVVHVAVPAHRIGVRHPRRRRFADARQWTPRRDRLRACSAWAHQEMGTAIRRVLLRGAPVPDSPRIRAWLRTRRVYPGGWIGLCYCSSSFIVSDPATDPAYVAQVVARVAKAHQVTPTQVLGPRRNPRLAVARAAVALELAELGWATTRIARAMGRARQTVATMLSVPIPRGSREPTEDP